MSESVQIVPGEYSVNFLYPPVEASESRLYRGVDLNTNQSVALKAYKDLSLQELKLYAELTNGLAKKYNGKEFRLSVNGKWRDFKIKIVTIDRVGISPVPLSTSGETCPCSVSEFIEGETLFAAEYDYRQLNPEQISADDPLVEMGRKWRRETGANNISLINWNIKPIFSSAGNTLVITDVCGIVAGLKVNKDYDPKP